MFVSGGKLAAAILAGMMGVLPVRAEFPRAEAVLDRAVVSNGDQARLLRLCEKAERGGTVVIGVLGGSITMGGRASAPEKRYANLLLDWFRKRFPKSDFTLINVGVGATGSPYGVLRLQRDLLCKKPDFLVLEYAVNDGEQPDHAEAYEGIVRQVLDAPWRPALLEIFTFRNNGENAQNSEVRVGNHYRVPMLSCRDALWPEMQAGRMKWSEYGRDTVHPNDAGHKFIAELVGAFLERSFRQAKKGSAAAEYPPLPAPLSSGIFDRSRIFEADELLPEKNSDWHLNMTNPHESGWESNTPGSSIEFKVSGEIVAICFWRIHGTAGRALARVDDRPPVKLDGWFEKTWGGFLDTRVLARDLKPGVHTVKVELLAEKNPAGKGNMFRIIAVGGGSRK